MNATRLLAAFAAAVLISGTASAGGWEMAMFADAEQRDERSARRDERADDLYDEGTDAIDEGQWEQALKHFGKVAELKTSRTDGALYWMAYALNKLGRRAEALKTIDLLKTSYASSQWIDDANALAIEVRRSRGEQVSPENLSDEELKVIAINSLMHTNPERAFPLLEKIVKGTGSSKKVKKQALFVLSQSSSPKAQALLVDIAKGAANPELQREAVNYLGVSGKRQVLGQLYGSVTDQRVREEILNAMMVAGDRASVLAAAKSEQDPRLRRKAVQLLGVMGARADLSAMYGTESAREVKKEILNALFVAGDVDRMTELAKAEPDSSLRRDAIQFLGLMGKRTAPTLLQLYATGDERIKDAVLDGLFVQGNARALIDLSKKETDKRMKRRILEKLSVMGNEEALEYMLEILKED